MTIEQHIAILRRDGYNAAANRMEAMAQDLEQGEMYFRTILNENKALERRLKHLLESSYIRGFDEYDPKTGTYKRDIREADRFNYPLHNSLSFASVSLERIAELATKAAKELKREG